MAVKDEQDELTQLIKYEKHELYRNAIRVRVRLDDDALVLPLSTPRESIPCSVVISECESVNLRIAMRDYSRRARH